VCPKIQRPQALQIALFDHPTVVFRPHFRELTQISAKTLHCQKQDFLRYILFLIVWVYFHSNLRGWLQKHTHKATERVMTVHGSSKVAGISTNRKRARDLLLMINEQYPSYLAPICRRKDRKSQIFVRILLVFSTSSLAQLAVNLFEFLNELYIAKSRVPRLSDRQDYHDLAGVVLIQYYHVTDRHTRTDRHADPGACSGGGSEGSGPTPAPAHGRFYTYVLNNMWLSPLFTARNMYCLKLCIHRFFKCETK